jgi:hypothetical protein
MRLTPWQGIGLLAAALVLGVLAIAHAAAPPTCSGADKAFEARRYTEAVKAYIAVLGEDPDSTCVEPHLTQSVRRLCRHANRLKARRHPEDAATAYSAIFKLEPARGQGECKKGDKPGPSPKTIVGPPGPKGDTGAKGDRGDKGDAGDKGDKGDPGAKGDPGVKGDPGENGDKGDKGATGDRGAKGERGDKGEQGDRGPRGAKGEKGDRGPRGWSAPCCTG